MDAASRRGSGGGLGNEAENRIAPAESGEAKLSSVTPHIAVTRSNSAASALPTTRLRGMPNGASESLNGMDPCKCVWTFVWTRPPKGLCRSRKLLNELVGPSGRF